MRFPASWYRQRFVDTRYRVKPNWVSLDDHDVDALERNVEAEWWWLDSEAINVEALTPESRKVYEQLAKPMVLFGLSLA